MKYSKLGYKRYSPDLYKKYNVIPSGRITMQDVDFPVYGIDNLGNEQMMYPGGEYQFPGNQVFEMPLYQQGGTRPPIYTSNPNDPRLRAYEDSLNTYNLAPEYNKRLLSDARWLPFEKQREAFLKLEEEFKKKGYNPDLWTKRVRVKITNPEGQREEDAKWKKSLKESGNRAYLAENASFRLVNYYKKPLQPVVYKKPVEQVEYRKPTEKTQVSPREFGIDSINFNNRIWQTLPKSVDSVKMDASGTNVYLMMNGKNSVMPKKEFTSWLQNPENRELYDRYRASQGSRYQQGGENDKEMVEGIADILSMVENPINRLDIANKMIQDFEEENVDYNLQDFFRMSEIMQSGGEQIKVRSGNTFDDYITNPLINAVAEGADAAGNWLNSTLQSATSSALNAMYTSPTMAPIAIQMQAAARPWLAQNIRPVAYPGIFTGVTELAKGALGMNPPPARDAQGDYSVDEEAWRKALGLPTNSKYIVPSNYKPSKAKDPNAQYYTLNRDVIDPKLLIAEAKRRNLQEGQSAVLSSLAPYIREGFMPRDEFSQVDPLQNFTIGVGKDKKGRYISIYDKYDFEGPLNSLTTPYEFYDRYYYAQGGQHGGLDRWFAEKWVDVKTGKECGRQAGEKRKGYPACRPSKRISSDTPKTASELSSAEKAKFKREKTSSKRIDYNHKRKEYGGSIPRFRKDMY
jgi:hypothetical protein